MLIPIRTDYRLTHKPWVNYGLVGMNVLLYFVHFHGGDAAGMQRINSWMLHPDNPRVFQFFSCMFLHAGFMHLFGNMIFLWVFGNAVNDRFGHVGYLAFYLAGGVLAGIGYLLLSGHAPVLGASGAISAVTGAYLVLFPRVRVTLLMFFYFITTFEVSSLYFLMFQFLLNLWMSFASGIIGYQAGGVAYVAHSSGYVFGIVVAAGLLATRLLPRDAFDLLNLMRGSQRRRRYRRMVGGGYDPFGSVSSKMHRPGKRWVDAETVESEAQDTPAAREVKLRREISEHFGRRDVEAATQGYLGLIQIADDAVLSKEQQLDVANRLMSLERHPEAADAYERFIKHYAAYEHLPDIFLMLGLLYGRYLHQYDRAEQALLRAIEGLTDPGKLEMARRDLQAVRHRR